MISAMRFVSAIIIVVAAWHATEGFMDEAVSLLTVGLIIGVWSSVASVEDMLKQTGMSGGKKK